MRQRKKIRYVRIVLHDQFEGFEKFFLEAKIRKFSLLEKLHRQLPKRVQGKEGHVLHWIACDLLGNEENEERPSFRSNKPY